MTRQSAVAATLTERAIALWVRGPRLAVLLLTLIVSLGTLGDHLQRMKALEETVGR